MRILLASASERRGSILRERFSNIEQNALKDVNETVPRGFISDQVEQVVSRKANAVKLDASFDVVVVTRQSTQGMVSDDGSCFWSMENDRRVCPGRG